MCGDARTHGTGSNFAGIKIVGYQELFCFSFPACFVKLECNLLSICVELIKFVSNGLSNANEVSSYYTQSE